jgi:cold shock CspA family protein
VACTGPPTATAILPDPAPIREESAMPQGTIRDFDPHNGRGSLLDDGLLEHVFDREAFTASGLQELRIGQRVRFELEGDAEDARVAHLNIVSL